MAAEVGAEPGGSTMRLGNLATVEVGGQVRQQAAQLGRGEVELCDVARWMVGIEKSEYITSELGNRFE
jgi:hypothetical protein